MLNNTHTKLLKLFLDLSEVRSRLNLKITIVIPRHISLDHPESSAAAAASLSDSPASCMSYSQSLECRKNIASDAPGVRH